LRFAEAKLSRAYEHLESVKTELESYWSSTPFTLTREDDLANAHHVVTGRLKDPSERLYLLVGDFAHNLRSVLDHIVYSLITEATGNTPTSNRVQWPVLQVPDPKVFAAQVGAMDQNAAGEIERLQPYRAAAGFKTHPLWQLNKLDIVDKHRRLSINKHAVNIVFPNLPKDTPYELSDTDAAYCCRIPIQFSTTSIVVSDKPVIWFGAEEEILVHHGDLQVICTFVADKVLPSFRKFFPRE
jgi:hypothetical protein